MPRRSRADRVVLGSLLFSDPEEAGRCVRVLGPGRCVAALDVKEERVFVKGWTEEAGATLMTACARAASLGLTEALVTDISRDGLLAGPALDLYEHLNETGLAIIASGESLRRRLGGPDAHAARFGRGNQQGALRRPAHLRAGLGVFHMKRIIPCLDVKESGVVKGVEVPEPTRRGRPVELAVRYDAEGPTSWSSWT